jgi:RHS repeat-associated protein
LLDGDQDVTDTYSYEAFGNLMASTGSTANPYRYVGLLGYYQTGSPVLHVGARCYAPWSGIWLQGDSIRYVDATNRRNYVGNNPLFYSDASGLSAKECCDPKKERDAIRERIRQLRQRLTARPPGGSFDEDGTGDAPATTGCLPYPVWGGYPLTIENPGELANPGYTPCIKKCLRAHEWWHRSQCRRLGWYLFDHLLNSNPWNLEDTAYAVEIECLNKLLRSR